MFRTGYHFNADQFDKIVNSIGTQGLFDAFEEIKRIPVFEVIWDNEAYFIFRRAMQESRKEDLKIRESNE